MPTKPTTKLLSNLLVAGILVLPAVLGGCKQASYAAAIPPSLTGAADSAISMDFSTNNEDEPEPLSAIYPEASLDGGEVEVEGDIGGDYDDANSYSTGSAAKAETAFVSATTTQLSELEADGLAYMREEEKLAHDVYLTLYNQWRLPIFQNISGSEQTHTDAVLRLLDQYGLADPAAGRGVGEFTNPILQSLYDELVIQGSRSLADALYVGGAIEELDILDLEERLANTDEAQIIQVYGNLLAGSENHLRAFVSTLERRTGESYQPTDLSQEVYEAIINGTQGRGNGNGGRFGANSDDTVGSANGVVNQGGRQFGRGRRGN